MVKKLPLDLTSEEVADLLQYFGARSVSVMSPKGIMKGTAFAEFMTKEEADIALQKLHQAPLFGTRLVVQYSDKNFMPVEPPDPMLYTEPTDPGHQTEQAPPKTTDSVPDPSLHYLYPPPTSHTLNNISHALVAVPQFYIQVLHLMNKMNLPPPFTQSSEKSLFDSSAKDTAALPSSSESELESDGEGAVEDHTEKEKEIMESKRLATQEFIESKTKVDERKRKRIASGGESSKVPKVDDMELSDGEDQGPSAAPCVPMVTAISISVPHSTIPPPSTVPVPPPSTTILPPASTVPRLNTVPPPPPPRTVPSPGTVPAPTLHKALPDTRTFSVSQITPARQLAPPSTPTTTPSMDIPQPTPELPSSSHTPPTVDTTPAISVPTVLKFMEKQKPAHVVAYESHRARVKSQRLPDEKLVELSVFKKYTAGDPSIKLYIKNINTKSVSEERLRVLFKPYFEFHNGEGEIKLMTRGQMKGQAFVTFPSVEAATDALEDCHGYVLEDKPIAVMFAKSR
eukprot:sb/3463940/